MLKLLYELKRLKMLDAEAEMKEFKTLVESAVILSAANVDINTEQLEKMIELYGKFKKTKSKKD